MLSIISLLFDHRLSLIGLHLSIRSIIYFGELLCIALYMIIHIINCNHCSGSQWRCINACVVLKYFQHCNTSLAHMFCIVWSMCMDFIGRPYSNAFHNPNVICITWVLVWCMHIWRDIFILPLCVWSWSWFFLFSWWHVCWRWAWCAVFLLGISHLSFLNYIIARIEWWFEYFL